MENPLLNWGLWMWGGIMLSAVLGWINRKWLFLLRGMYLVTGVSGLILLMYRFFVTQGNMELDGDMYLLLVMILMGFTALQQQQRSRKP
ncbi:hypothetical protein [Deinococcus misasensis]|uniref:hypothetical protein n=1 Tax=Deinococcus misasensis TaxID=392413 RepID=UPI000A8A2190|nr:hypothetical protein [Deinococcus misasensis]